MTAVLEGVVFLVLVALIVLVVVTYVSGRLNAPSGDAQPAPDRLATVSDRHKHRWTRWQVVDERRIHLYGEVDEGRELPDRIDVVLRRECARCGLPQTQTVRGLDPKLRD